MCSTSEDKTSSTGEFKITLRASKKNAKANEQVALGVKIENNDCPVMLLNLPGKITQPALAVMKAYL